MKRISYTLSMLLLMAVPTLFTSCDDEPPYDPYDYYSNYYGDWYDDYDWYNDNFDYGTAQLTAMAQCLRGHWGGTLTNVYTDDNGERQAVNMNVQFEFDQYDASSLNGRGQEIDYVGDKSQELRFSWYIDPRTGNINIKYDKSGYTFVLDAKNNTQDSGFSLDKNAFNGVMEGVNNDELVYFDCTRNTLSAQNTSAWQAPAVTTPVASKRTLDAPMKFRRR